MKALFSVLAMVFTMQAAYAADPKAISKEDLVKFVEDGKEYIKKNGKEKAFAVFNDEKNPLFQKGELYFFAYDMNGKCIQHGKKPGLIGTDAIKLEDKKGKFLIKEMVELAKSKKVGFVEYYWPNPANKNQVEKKLGYITEVDGQYLIGSGIYLGKE